MLKLSAREDDRVEQLLDLRVAHLCVREYFTDEVNRPLNGEDVSFLASLDYYGRADHLGGRGDIEEERFGRFWRDEDRWRGEHTLELGKGFLGLDGPREML
jgi:hypothetical protein